MIVLALLAAALWHWWSNDPVNGHYKTVTIDRGPITSLVTATGAVNPVISVQVGSQVSGKIAKLYADFNSVVREGQVLASIERLLIDGAQKPIPPRRPQGATSKSRIEA